MLSDDLDSVTNKIEQGFMQRNGWKDCRYLLGKIVKEEQSKRPPAPQGGGLENKINEVEPL